MIREIAALEARLEIARGDLLALEGCVAQLAADISKVIHHELSDNIVVEWRKLTQALADLTLAADELLSMTRRE